MSTPHPFSLAGHQSLPTALGLISVLFVRNTQIHSRPVRNLTEPEFSSNIWTHLSITPLCFLNQFSRSPPRRQTGFVSCHPVGIPLSIVTSSQSVDAVSKPNNKQ
ncbi:hypothetical protein TNCV_1304191 [Trichonephila clavipes]|nr:hypothetical protein TNCV_1304191 [Trichonephila clavipes]